MMKYDLRLGKPEDHAYIVDTWLASQKSPEPVRTRKIRMRELLGSAMVRIAHVYQDEDAILGWAVVKFRDQSPAAVHYVYVRGGRSGARGLGIGHALVCDLGPGTIYHSIPDPSVHIPEGWSYEAL